MHGKNPTRRQKALIASKGLICRNWLVVKDTSVEMHIKHRLSDNVRVISKLPVTLKEG